MWCAPYKCRLSVEINANACNSYYIQCVLIVNFTALFFIISQMLFEVLCNHYNLQLYNIICINGMRMRDVIRTVHTCRFTHTYLRRLSTSDITNELYIPDEILLQGEEKGIN